MKTNAAIIIATITLLILSCNNNNAKDPVVEASNKIAYPPNIQNLIAKLNAQPDSNKVRVKLAFALDSIGDFTNALKQIDTAVKKDTGNNLLWINRGNIAEDAKDTLMAMESYTKAIRIYETPDAMLWLARLYAEKQNPRALLITSRIKALALGKDYDAHSAYIAGIYYARTGKRPEAVQKFDECIANNYTYMEAYIEKGLVYFDNRQFNEALKIFQFAATVNNLYADAYYYQARCYEMTNKKDSAIQKFQQSLGLDKTLAEAHDGLKRLGAE